MAIPFGSGSQTLENIQISVFDDKLSTLSMIFKRIDFRCELRGICRCEQKVIHRWEILAPVISEIYENGSLKVLW